MIKQQIKEKGFTLIEMLVVVAIVAVIMTITVFNYQNANHKSILKNVAYDIALSIREIQSVGLGAKKYTTSEGANSFNTTFGVQFNSGEEKYMLFADEDDTGSGANNCSDLITETTLCSCPDGECLSEIGSAHTGIVVYDSCVSDLSPSGDPDLFCISDGFVGSDYTSVIFKRPNPDARIYSSDSAGVSQLMRIFLRSKASDDAQMIKITNTGQISVKNCDLDGGNYKTDCI